MVSSTSQRYTIPRDNRLVANRNVSLTNEDIVLVTLTATRFSFSHYVTQAALLPKWRRFAIPFGIAAFLFLIGFFPLSITITLVTAWWLVAQYFTIYYTPLNCGNASIVFLPHVVSSVLADISHNTPVDVAMTTVRQKIQRLGSLPIPDFDAIKLIRGSELIIQSVLESSNFVLGGCRTSAISTPTNAIAACSL